MILRSTLATSMLGFALLASCISFVEASEVCPRGPAGAQITCAFACCESLEGANQGSYELLVCPHDQQYLCFRDTTAAIPTTGRWSAKELSSHALSALLPTAVPSSTYTFGRMCLKRTPMGPCHEQIASCYTFKLTSIGWAKQFRHRPRTV